MAASAGTTYLLALRPGDLLPPLRPSGYRTIEEAALALGAKPMPEKRLFGGPSLAVYAYPRVTTHRNIYRIPVPQ